MNQLLIVVILIIGTLPLYGQGQQPNTAELAQKVVGIIAGDTTKTQTYCQVLDLSDELDQVDQPKDRKKAEDLSQKINELQKTLAPNTSRCSRLLWTSIQIPKTVRRSCRSSISSIVPAGTNGDVIIRSPGLRGSWSHGAVGHNEPTAGAVRIAYLFWHCAYPTTTVE
jgi:hypothetical protein